MARTKLTESSRKSAKAKAKPYEIRDVGNGSVKGLLLRIQPSGHGSYYVELSRGVREFIGSKDSYTLEAARTEAQAKLGEAAQKGAAHFKGKRERKRREKAATLLGYIDGEFKEYAEKNIATHDGTISRVKKSFAELLDKSMAEITELDLARWDRGRRKAVSVETRRRELAALKAILNRAVKDKLIDAHHVGGFRVKAETGEEHGEAKLRFLTADEEKRLRSALDKHEVDAREARDRGNEWRRERDYELKPEFGPDEYADHLKPLVLLALLTGLRRGDLFGLKWEHVDLERRQIRKVIEKTSHVRRKAGKKLVPAVLPLSSEAHEILTQLNVQRDPKSEYVFSSPKTGTRLDNVKNGFASILKSAGITDFRFHDLRHTFASRLALAGVDLNTIRELMTHSDISMTLVYAHLTEAHKAEAVEKAFRAVVTDNVAAISTANAS